ncbi:MAG: AAA family ATPase [Kiritimatiellales bacterium]
MGVKAENREYMRGQVNEILESSTVPLSQAEAARRIGISPGSLSNWLRGKKGSYTEIEEKIQTWLDSFCAMEKVTDTIPPDPDWIPTPTADRIYKTIEYGQFSRKLVVIYGAAGAGKTKTAEHYQDTMPNVWMFTMTKATASVRGMLMMLCDELNIEDPCKGNRVLEKAIINKIRRTNGMMLIDEAQQASMGALEQLRQMQERAGIGMALIGNFPLIKQMTGGFRSEQFAQLFSRIAKPTEVKETIREDVEVFVDAFGITDSDAVEYLCKIGTRPGGLRGVVNSIQWAQMVSAGSGRKLDCKAIAEAWEDLTA